MTRDPNPRPRKTADMDVLNLDAMTETQNDLVATDLVRLAEHLAWADAMESDDVSHQDERYWAVAYGQALAYTTPARFRSLTGAGRRFRVAQLSRAGVRF